MYSSCASIRTSGWLERAAAAARKTGAARAMRSAISGATDLGETRCAIEHYEQSLSIMREIGDRLFEGAVLAALGIAYKDLGETRRAIEKLRETFVI